MSQHLYTPCVWSHFQVPLSARPHRGENGSARRVSRPRSPRAQRTEARTPLTPQLVSPPLLLPVRNPSPRPHTPTCAQKRLVRTPTSFLARGTKSWTSRKLQPLSQAPGGVREGASSTPVFPRQGRLLPGVPGGGKLGRGVPRVPCLLLSEPL